MHDAKFRDFVHWCQYQHRQHLAGEDTRFWRYIEKKVRPRHCVGWLKVTASPSAWVPCCLPRNCMR